uniref:Uncharacterized protein n=1 Tax=Kalanchoe fedtschenkoi TaxID=63787 RepID=A0A7N1A9G8_KALFE
MEPAAHRVRQPQVHRPDDRWSAAGHQINSKPVLSRSVSTKVAASSTMKTRPSHQQDGQISSSKAVSKSQVWDCGSSLYDSFELDSFNRQLDSAIKASSRTLSMPHLPERRLLPPAPDPVMTITKHHAAPKKFGNVSKSVQKILRSVFRSSKSVNDGATNGPFIKAKTTGEKAAVDSFYVYDGSKSMRVLTTIPEMQEMDGHPAKFSLDTTPVVRRAASERCTAAALSRLKIITAPNSV